MLNQVFHGVTVNTEEIRVAVNKCNTVELFVSAKRIEGCSEKTLAYYSKTIEVMLETIGKTAQQITTEDLRKYLITYQLERGSSKVTIDNIRRILSSFFRGWKTKII